MAKKFGLLLRSYAKTSEDISGVVARAVSSVKHANTLRDKDDNCLVSSVSILVPRDYDCGGTANAIRENLPSVDIKHINVLVVRGHHSSHVLNEGLSFLDNVGVDRAVIVSHKAIKLLTADILVASIEAFAVGAKVVGVAFDELESVVLQGRVQNTLAIWDVKALRLVGGFDSDDGVEEIAPTVRLLREYGPCVAVLVPSKHATLDIRKTIDGVARHNEVMSTKIARQEEEILRIGENFAFIKIGILQGYPLMV